MDFQLAELDHIIDEMHAHGKKVLIHLDLIKGLASDQYGAIYCIQTLNIEGIVTSKPKVIQVCKKREVLGILRIFLKDRHSLKQGLDVIEECKPDIIEVLPFMPQILPYISKKFTKKIFMGGLITHQKHINQCIENGANSITTSKIELWNPLSTQIERKI